MKILKLEDQYRLNIALYFHKTLNSNNDPDLYNLLQFQSDIHHHNTRRNSLLSVPRCNKTKSKSCMHFSGVGIWNNLPRALQTQVSLPSFKRSLTEYYLSLY